MNIGGGFYDIRFWGCALWDMLRFKLGLKIPGLCNSKEISQPKAQKQSFWVCSD